MATATTAAAPPASNRPQTMDRKSKKRKLSTTANTAPRSDPRGHNSSSSSSSHATRASAPKDPKAVAAGGREDGGTCSRNNAGSTDAPHERSRKRAKHKMLTPSSLSSYSRSRQSEPHTLETATAVLPDDHDAARALKSLEDKFDVQIYSVISSSKMQKKVSSVLRHLLESSSSSTSGGGHGRRGTGEGERGGRDAMRVDSDAAVGDERGAEVSFSRNNDIKDKTNKPRVTVLRAKASDAGKLVSIAEIAKREMSKVAATPKPTTDDGSRISKTAKTTTPGTTEPRAGVWYQYICVGEELQERERGGVDLVEETVLDNSRSDNGDGGDDDGDCNENDEDEDDFEIMKTRFERAIEGTPLVRGVPIMSLFLSRVPIEDLRRRFGEQTNAR